MRKEEKLEPVWGFGDSNPVAHLTLGRESGHVYTERDVEVPTWICEYCRTVGVGKTPDVCTECGAPLIDQ